MELLPKLEEKESLSSQVSVDDAVNVSREIIGVYEKLKSCAETVKLLPKNINCSSPGEIIILKNL